MSEEDDPHRAIGDGRRYTGNRTAGGRPLAQGRPGDRRLRGSDRDDHSSSWYVRGETRDMILLFYFPYVTPSFSFEDLKRYLMFGVEDASIAANDRLAKSGIQLRWHTDNGSGDMRRDHRHARHPPTVDATAPGSRGAAGARARARVTGRRSGILHGAYGHARLRAEVLIAPMLVLATLVGACCHSGLAASAPAPTPFLMGTTAGRTQWRGRNVDFTLSFDADAVAQIVSARRHVMVRTTSGHLLGVERSTWQPVTTRVLSPALTYLAHDRTGAVVGGLADGSVVLVDDEQLTLQLIGKTAGAVACIVPTPRRDGGDLVIVWREAAAYRAGVLTRGAGMRVWSSELAMPTENGAFGAFSCTLSADGRLWYGIHAGEWGGGAGWLNVTSGESALVPNMSEGVRGFVSRRDGEVWLFGGTSGSYIGSVSPAGVRPVYQRKRAAASDTGRDGAWFEAGVDVGMVLELDRDVLVSALDELYRVDPLFTKWELLTRLRPSAGAIHAPRTVVTAWVQVDGHTTLIGTNRGLYELTSRGAVHLPLSGPTPPSTPEDESEGRARSELVVRIQGELDMEVYDAIPWSKGAYLVATHDGIFVYDRVSGSRRRPSFRPPPGPVWALAVDEGGWLWLGATGLWVVPGGDRDVAQPIDGVAGLSLRPVTWIASRGRHSVVAGSWPDTRVTVVVGAHARSP